MSLLPIGNVHVAVIDKTFDGQLKWPFLHQMGCDHTQLQAGINPCPHVLGETQLTNGAVYELSRHNLKWTVVRDMLKTWMGDRFPDTCEYRKVQAVVKRVVKGRLVLMKKRKTPESMKALQTYLQEPFTITGNIRHENVSGRSGATHTADVVAQTCGDTISYLQTELAAERAKNRRHKVESARVRHNLNRIVKRRTIAVQRKNSQLRKKAARVKSLEKKRKTLEEAVARRNVALSEASRHLALVTTSTQTLPEVQDCRQCSRYEHHIEQLQKDPPTVITLKDGRQYSDATVKCVLSLLSHNVGYAHISPVIASVLRLANVTADHLPCLGTIENISKLRLPLAHINVGDPFAATDSLTLYTDETKKRGQQFETYVVTNENHEAKALGVREIPDKSALTNVQTLKEAVEDAVSFSGNSDGDC